MKTTITPIDSGWTMAPADDERQILVLRLPKIDARVPGHAHLDLMRAGVIPDPFARMQERDALWVDEADWIYETTFYVAEAPVPGTFLRFHGIDTVAEIELNGELLGTVDNMYIPHEFSVDGRLRFGQDELGANSLKILFRSARRIGNERKKAWEESGEDVAAPHWDHWAARSFVRKSQYMFGWDWGPALLSCGLWQPVEIVSMPTARLLDFRYTADLQPDGRATVNLTIYLERSPSCADKPLRVRAAVTEVRDLTTRFDDPLPEPTEASVPAGLGRTAVTLSLHLEAARLWQPNTHNPDGAVQAPTLYALELAILDAAELVDCRTARVGLRTIELIREPDSESQGEGFKFRVNGHDIFVRGANWIPADSFPSTLDADGGRIERLVSMAASHGFNMLRVWGGGLYESERFYDLCDEYGILVWQDFPYACAHYPDSEPWRQSAFEEATAAVRRLRTHPSLALLCGNNENHWFFDHDSSDPARSRFLGKALYEEVLPAVVDAEAPHVAYWPSSPYGGDNANDPNYGDTHYWNVWHGAGDWIHYREDNCRFCSEFGFAASPSRLAWDTVAAPADRTPYSPVVRWHDKTRRGYETYLGFVHMHFPEIRSFDDLVYFTQLNQMEALKYGIEHYRRNKGRNWGTLVWQLNDCWPVHSWSMVDYLLQKKTSMFAARAFYAPLLLSLTCEEGMAYAHLINDTLAPRSGRLEIRLETFSGDVLASAEHPVTVDANGVLVLPPLNLASIQGRERETLAHAEFTAWDTGHTAASMLFFSEPKEWAVGRAPEVSVDMTQIGHIQAAIRALDFTPYVWLQAEDEKGNPVAAEYDDNGFHLTAGATRTIAIRGAHVAAVRVRSFRGAGEHA